VEQFDERSVAAGPDGYLLTPQATPNSTEDVIIQDNEGLKEQNLMQGPTPSSIKRTPFTV